MVLLSDGQFWGHTQPGEKQFTHMRAALDFQKALGLKDIGTEYVLPRNLSAEAMEREIRQRVKWDLIPMEERKKRALEYADAFTVLNPSLKPVRFNRDDLLQVWHVLLGVTSCFNPDDIDYFINNIDQLNTPQQNFSDKLKRSLRSEFNVAAELYWRPSEKTAQRVLEQMNAKPKPF